jgi:hypothetical protein
MKHFGARSMLRKEMTDIGPYDARVTERATRSQRERRGPAEGEAALGEAMAGRTWM